MAMVGRGCIDETIVVDKFADITKPEIQEELREKNTIFIHNRYYVRCFILQNKDDGLNH